MIERFQKNVDEILVPFNEVIISIVSNAIYEFFSFEFRQQVKILPSLNFSHQASSTFFAHVYRSIPFYEFHSLLTRSIPIIMIPLQLVNPVN